VGRKRGLLGKLKRLDLVETESPVWGSVFVKTARSECMSKFMVEINTDNSAYETDYYEEVIANLKSVIANVDCSELNGIIRDTNGNKVGRFFTHCEEV
jgi:hypothetical protein